MNQDQYQKQIDTAMAQHDANDYYDNQLEFFGKFILSPDIKEYEHLSKNLSTTNLRSKYYEPERARLLLGKLHTLNKYRFKRKDVQYVGEEVVYFLPVINFKGNILKVFLADLEEAEEFREVYQELFNDSINVYEDKKPIEQEVVVEEYCFPKMVKQCLSEFYSLVATASATNGFLMNRVMTKSFVRSESIEDRTEVKPGFFFGAKKKPVNQENFN